MAAAQQSREEPEGRKKERGGGEGGGRGRAHAPLARRVKLGRVDVDGDDARRARALGRLDDGEADGAEAEDRDRRAGLHLGGVEDGAPPRRHAAAEQADLVERRRLVDDGDALLVHDGVAREARGAHEVEERLAVDRREARLAVSLHDALAGERAHAHAEVGLGVAAELARAAVGLVARDHVVARLDARDALADALDDSRRLVAEHAREEALGVEAVERVGVGVAERRRDDLDAHLAGARRRDDDLLIFCVREIVEDAGFQSRASVLKRGAGAARQSSDTAQRDAQRSKAWRALDHTARRRRCVAAATGRRGKLLPHLRDLKGLLGLPRDRCDAFDRLAGGVSHPKWWGCVCSQARGVLLTRSVCLICSRSNRDLLDVTKNVSTHKQDRVFRNEWASAAVCYPSRRR